MRDWKGWKGWKGVVDWKRARVRVKGEAVRWRWMTDRKSQCCQLFGGSPLVFESNWVAGCVMNSLSRANRFRSKPNPLHQNRQHKKISLFNNRHLLILPHSNYRINPQ